MCNLLLAIKFKSSLTPEIFGTSIAHGKFETFISKTLDKGSSPIKNVSVSSLWSNLKSKAIYETFLSLPAQ